jgi:tRNA (guanine-N7-)-methyltransferase
MFDPYAHAPRLPDEGPIDLRQVFERAPSTGLEDQGAQPSSSQFEAAQLEAAQLRPVELEIGPGRGWFILERLDVSPELRVVGLEIKKKWATIVDERLKERGLGHRGRTFFADARLIIPRLVPQQLSHVYLHFPDPWWKRRHEKRLVLSPELLLGLSRAMIPDGELFVQTDVEHRARAYAETLSQDARFGPVDEGPWVQDHPYVARSPRERIAVRDGIPVFRLRFRRLPSVD